VVCDHNHRTNVVEEKEREWVWVKYSRIFPCHKFVALEEKTSHQVYMQECKIEWYDDDDVRYITRGNKAWNKKRREEKKEREL